MASTVKQENISLNDGSVVGRDQITTNYNINGRISQMTRLAIQYIEESSQDSKFSETLPELEHYMSNIDEKEVRGLRKKLTHAGRHDEFKDASRQKEIIAKKLHKYSTSKSAQKIFVYLLGYILNNFRARVRPMISAGASKTDIDICILDNVIQPAVEMLEDNVLDLFWDDIWGMVYYLTGNCHIDWVE